MAVRLFNKPGGPWADLSSSLSHLVRAEDDAAAYDTMMSLLSEARLRAGGASLGYGRAYAELAVTHVGVCLTETPLPMLSRFRWRSARNRRWTQHGIGFSREFITSRGGGPVIYLEKGCDQERAVRQLIEARLPDPDPRDPLWKLTALMDAPGRYRGRRWDFRWQREWRVVGDLEFEPTDVAFLLMPERFHESAAAFFEDAERHNTGPRYACPFLDPWWSSDKWESAWAESRKGGGD